MILKNLLCWLPSFTFLFCYFSGRFGLHRTHLSFGKSAHKQPQSTAGRRRLPRLSAPSLRGRRLPGRAPRRKPKASQGRPSSRLISLGPAPSRTAHGVLKAGAPQQLPARGELTPAFHFIRRKRKPQGNCSYPRLCLGAL